MYSVKRWRAVLAVAATALVMSACGGGSDAGSGDDAADGDPVSGGSVSIIQMSEPRILDPGVMSNALSTNAIVGNALFGQLIAEKSDGTFDYLLAESLESDDGERPGSSRCATV